MYEESWVPEKLPGGGGFSLKNLSLYSLYIEHTMGHNVFTHTNKDYPLMRYLGCSLKLYQSSHIDYVCTYSNTWPLKSNMQMYNSMQPSIHLLQQNKIIVPSKNTQKRHKPYVKKFIKPPTQMQNKWYFQSTLSKIPLFMLRTTAISLDHYYIGSRMQSTNITIISLNTAYIQNRGWGTRTTYWNQELGTQRYFLYGTKQEITETTSLSTIKIVDLIPLTNTVDDVEGDTYPHGSTLSTLPYNQYVQKYAGNPFHTNYLQNHWHVITTTNSPSEIAQLVTNWGDTQWKTKTLNDLTYKTYTYVPMTVSVRYNPYRDNGQGNTCYFLPIKTTGHGYVAPTREDLRNDNLPLWLLLFGFPDFIKKTDLIHHVDTDQILVIETQKTNPQKSPLVPLSLSFYEGRSPYTDPDDPKVDPSDTNRWYPMYQYQQEILNNICLAGPGTPKIPTGTTAEAKVKYCFYFKWGGELPQMSQIEDPTDQATYPIPNNLNTTTSLQNPTSAPETYLYSFDERRGQLTKTATERIQKDWETKKIPLLPTEYRFAEQTTTEETQTDPSSEEEEEDLFQLLNRQRSKQLRLRKRILKTLQQLQKLE